MTGIYGQCVCGEEFHSLIHKEEHICLKKISEIHNELQDMLISSFKGVPLMVDDNLSGNMWYVAVSKELYQAVQEAKG